MSPFWSSHLRSPSLVDPQAAINRFAAETNEKPKFISWNAVSDEIIAAVK